MQSLENDLRNLLRELRILKSTSVSVHPYSMFTSFFKGVIHGLQWVKYDFVKSFKFVKICVQGTLPRKKNEPENVHAPKWVPETYSQSDSEDSEILIPEGPNHVHAAMSDSDSESSPETKSNSKKKSRSKSKSRVERQRSSTPKLPTPQKVSIAGVSGPATKQFRTNSRVAELMSKFSYFQSESEETIKSSMKSKFQRFILRQDKSFMIFYQFKYQILHLMSKYLYQK